MPLNIRRIKTVEQLLMNFFWASDYYPKETLRRKVDAIILNTAIEGRYIIDEGDKYRISEKGKKCIRG